MSLLNELPLLDLNAAGRLFPGQHGAKYRTRTTVLRWITDGCRSVSGQIVRLEGVRVGRSWYTTRQAVERFTLALSEQPQPAQQQRKKRLKKLAEVHAQLDALGL